MFLAYRTPFFMLVESWLACISWKIFWALHWCFRGPGEYLTWVMNLSPLYDQLAQFEAGVTFLTVLLWTSLRPMLWLITTKTQPRIGLTNHTTLPYRPRRPMRGYGSRLT